MLNRIFTRNMSQQYLKKIISNAETAEKRVAELKNKLEEIKRIRIEDKIKELTHENKVLLSKVETAKANLIQLEILNGKKQYSLPNRDPPTPIDVTLQKSVNEGKLSTPKKGNKIEESKKEKLSGKSNTESTIDVRKLDFRIGKIVEINKHPDADTLYVEKIDCGEAVPRTVVSGLVNHVPIDEMRNRIVMVLCNLKPVKMRGITSEAMVMCASSPEKVEVLIPPSGAEPGDLVSCEGFPREPEPVLNPKKKIFETCSPHLQTNDDNVACYKGSPLIVPGKGPVVAPTLKGVNVK